MLVKKIINKKEGFITFFAFANIFLATAEILTLVVFQGPLIHGVVSSFLGSLFGADILFSIAVYFAIAYKFRYSIILILFRLVLSSIIGLIIIESPRELLTEFSVMFFLNFLLIPYGLIIFWFYFFTRKEVRAYFTS